MVYQIILIQNSEITYPLVFFSYKKVKKVKTIMLSHVQKREKNHYFHHPFVFKCLIPIYICYLIEFKNFNYLYKKNTKLIFQKKKPITSHKNYSFLSRNFYDFFFLILWNIPKFVLSRSYTIITNPHLSTLMYIIFFCSNLKFFNLSQFLS